MGAIPRDRRVTTRGEILRLLRGPGVQGANLELHWRPAAEGVSRATCITPKYGHTSVERNRLRRRLTALLASELLSRPEPCDYLVRARSGAYDLDFQELSRALQALAKEMTT
ncbi:MAG TPA: ribonuclease P protein component [Gemmatimonadota bacterium]|nr:ribonuclease P protein component [Gemmatimonadota bacterium]